MALQSRKDLILSLGFQLNGWSQLEKFAQHLMAFNQDYNLVSRKITEQDLVDNHIVDCLLPLKQLIHLTSVIDFGTGGGFPALIYAIQFPNVPFHLFEKSSVKKQYLESAKKLFAPNLEIHGAIEKKLPLASHLTARAFKPIPEILKFSQDHFNRGGEYFLLKGRAEKIQEELNETSAAFKNKTVKVTALKSPLLDVERHLVQIQRNKE